ncbi:MAG: 30S ribosome-binding factor RbfA [Pirellulaceae bacterium]|nr:30S ribosome-binding factor RbfA [Pirellulaceae bacterium]
MSTRRTLKVAQAIRQVVSMAVLTQLKDPRIKDVTIVGVDVTPDLQLAKVRITVRDASETKENLCLRGLRNAAGFLQQKVAVRLDTRYTPKLKFVVDKGMKNSLEVARILDELAEENEESKDVTVKESYGDENTERQEE